jgi:hypothetical protein
MTTALETIGDALRCNGKTVVRQTDKLTAQCPAHDDHKPSLSVIPRRDGTGVTVHCHAGCDHMEVLAALGLSLRDCFDEPNLRAVFDPRAVYTYPGGRRVHREPGKRFWQDGDKTDRSLFGADLITPGTTRVLIVEGEKDALVGQEMGEATVTASQGASSAARADWTPVHGLDVTLVMDNDEAGRKWAHTVAGLLEGKVRSLTLAVAKVGKDLADHYVAGFGLADLTEVPLTAIGQASNPGPSADRVRSQRNQFDAITLSEVKPEKVDWLWPGHVPRGKPVTLDGDPGVGKSTLALTFASIVSTGGTWPDGTTCERPGAVILMSAEDGLADTIVPRLIAAGADMTKVHAVRGVPMPPDSDGHVAMRMPTLGDVAQLRRLITDTGAALVVFDVLMAYLPSRSDSHRDQDMRALLSPLTALAEETGCTMLLLRHLTKGKGEAMYRGGGSIGIVGAARVGLIAAPDPDEPEQRVLAVLKNNLAAKAPALTYRLTPADNGVARVEWIGETEHDAESLLGEHDGGGGLNAAQAWLEDHLIEQGRAPSRDVKAAARKAGFSERTIQRAAGKLRVVPESYGFPRTTHWSLPQSGHPTPVPTGRGATGATGTTGFDLQEPEGQRGATAQSRHCAALGTTRSQDAESRCRDCGVPLANRASIAPGLCAECRLVANEGEAS